MTKVTFYVDHNDGQILAYFPGLVADQKGNKTCYAHIGQHSACSPAYVRTLKRATTEQYKDLLRELVVHVEYDDLQILNAPELDIETIQRDYLVCALWASDCEGSIYDIPPAITEMLNKQVAEYVKNNMPYLVLSGLSAEQIGHSLYLTQGHHGAGFFDFPMPDIVEQRLTEQAHKLQSFRLEYLSADQLTPGLGLKAGIYYLLN